MEQSRVMSLVEVATSSLIGLVVSVFANWVNDAYAGHNGPGYSSPQ
jgi:hypothetical protein